MSIFCFFNQVCPFLLLFPLDLKKQNGDASEDDEEEEVNEVEEDDRDLFADQLISVAAMGRATPQHSIPILTKWVHIAILNIPV